MRAFGLVLLIATCKNPERIGGEQRAAPHDAGAVGDTAAPDVLDAESPDAGDATADACVPGDTWEARVVTRSTWHTTANMMLPGPLELVVPRMGARKTIYPDCGITGGGCGDCTKPKRPNDVSCDRKPASVRVDIGIDDVGPTYVEVHQQGSAIVADWTRGGFITGPGDPGTSTKSREVLLVLPCAVTIRFAP